MSDYQKDVITIREVSDTPDKIKIKAENGKTYSIFKQWEGKNTDAYTQFRTGNHGNQFGAGDHAAISYKEKPGEYQGKTFYYRNIVSLFPSQAPASQATIPAPSAKEARIGQNIASQSKPERDYDSENIGKCQFGFLQAYIQSGHSIQDAKLQVTAARQLAELVVHGTQQTTKEELPTIQVDEVHGDPTKGEMNPMVNDDDGALDSLAQDIPF